LTKKRLAKKPSQTKTKKNEILKQKKTNTAQKKPTT
jgi:hypothetical protein